MIERIFLEQKFDNGVVTKLAVNLYCILRTTQAQTAATLSRPCLSCLSHSHFSSTVDMKIGLALTVIIIMSSTSYSSAGGRIPATNTPLAFAAAAAGPANNDDQQQQQQQQKTEGSSDDNVPQLPPSDPNANIPTIKLGETIKFDEVGPIILNTDGSTRTIDNWNEMTEREQEVTWRRISKRNEQRRKMLMEQAEQQQQQNGGPGP